MNVITSKKTPLFDDHVGLGAKMVEFAGWNMPIQYRGIIEEHRAVRNAVGLFDVSHMGEIWFRGPKSLESLQWMTSNDVSKLQKGQAQYSLITNDRGGVVDDIIIYCVSPNDEYLVCVNAANKDKDLNWFKAHNKGSEIIDESHLWGQIAVQGPNAIRLVEKTISSNIGSLKPFNFDFFEFKQSKVIVARTGYTGEDGVEVFVPWESTSSLWNKLLSEGKDLGVQPIGLGARDTLRLEAKFPLYGHELNDESNPLEARLGWVVKLEKIDFIGKSEIAKVKGEGNKRELVGFKTIEKGIPRESYKLLDESKRNIGFVTSGTMSPSLGEGIGVGYVEKAFSKEGMFFYVEIRGRSVKAQVVKTPFVSAKKV